MAHSLPRADGPVRNNRFQFSGRHYNDQTITDVRTQIMRHAHAMPGWLPVLLLLLLVLLAAPGAKAVPLQVYGQLLLACPI
jgi:hypothetical protein